MTDRALVQNAADPKQLKKAKRLVRLAQERETNDLLGVMATEQGRRFVWGLLCKAGVFQVSHRTGQPDLSAFMEGRREFGLQLMLRVTDIDPELYHRMAKDAHAREQASQPPKAESIEEQKQADTEEDE